MLFFTFIVYVFNINVLHVYASQVLFDDFSRENNKDLGNDWIEHNESTEPYYSPISDKTYSPFYVELEDGAAEFVCTELSSGEIPTRSLLMVEKSLSESVHLPTKWGFTYTPDDSERIHHEFGIMNKDFGTRSLLDYENDFASEIPNEGIMLGVYKSDSYTNNSSLRFFVDVDGNRTEYFFDKPSLAFQLKYGNKYTFNIEIDNEGNVSVYVSDGVSEHIAHTKILNKKIITNSTYNSFLINPTQGCAGYGYTSPDVEVSFDDIFVSTLTNIKPEIVLDGNNPVVVALGDMYVDPGYTASDEEDGDITEDVVFDIGSLDTSVAGEYEVFYSVQDSVGAVATATRKVIVKDGRSSSVAFLHGLPASRLYHKKGEKEKRVWETASAGKISYIGFAENGKSKHNDIYTRDILDSFRPLTGWWKMADGYEDWMDFMDGLVEDGTIKEWKPIAYDWRLAQDELVRKGKDIGDDNVSYLTEPGSVPYIISSLKKLAENSPTGKVTIIAHSNGGLVVKNLIKYLEETGNDLLDKIDTVVLVASPQEGTPKSLREILHGTDTLHKGVVREAVENMPGVYGLLPSSTLMSKLDEPVIEVDKSVKKAGPLNDIAGRKISTYDELRAFLVKDIGVRFKPGPLQTLIPNVLNLALLKSAQNMHDKIDSMDFPDGIRFVQLAGTGLVTARGVRYGARKDERDSGKKKPHYISTVEWLSNTKGDGTVLTASAVSGNADETYYFDMGSYNNDHETNYTHATILSAVPVQQFIKKDILNKETEIPLYISTNNTDNVPASRFELRAYSPVDIHLYRYGLHTGVVGDETTELGRYYEEKVPNSYYEEWAEVKYLGADLIKGDTDIKLDGTGDGVFTLVMDIFEGDTKTVSHTFSNVSVTADSEGEFDFDENEIPVIEYDYDGDGEVDMTIHADGEEQEASFALLKSEIKKLNTKAKKVLLRTGEFAESMENKGRTRIAIRTLHVLNRQVKFLSSKRVPAKYRISKSEAENIKTIVQELILQLKTN